MAFATVPAESFGVGVGDVKLVTVGDPSQIGLFCNLTPAAETDSDLYSTKSAEFFETGIPRADGLLVILVCCELYFGVDMLDTLGTT